MVLEEDPQSVGERKNPVFTCVQDSDDCCTIVIPYRLLRERMLERERSHAHMLAAEEDYHQSKLQVLEKRLLQSRLLERLVIC